MPTLTSLSGPAPALPAFPRRLVPSSPPLLGIVGDAARIDGTFEIADSIEVDCQVSGELTVGHTLVVGPLGTVAAEVRTVDVVVRGRYDGHLVATGSVEIRPCGRVTGHIETDSLIIEQGGVFQATVSRLGDREPGSTRAPLHRLNTRSADLGASRSP